MPGGTFPHPAFLDPSQFGGQRGPFVFPFGFGPYFGGEFEDPSRFVALDEEPEDATQPQASAASPSRPDLASADASASVN